MKKLLLLIMTLSIICFAACEFGNIGGASSSDSIGNSSVSSENNSSDISDESGSSSSGGLSSDNSDNSSDLGGNDSAQKQIYTITFKQEGVEDIVKTVEEGASLTDIPVPNQIVGYEVEWNVTDFSNVTQNATVTIVKIAKKYKISYTLGSRENDEMAKLANKEQQVR